MPVQVVGQDTVRLEPRIELDYFQVNDQLPSLTTRVRVKKDKGWEPVSEVNVNLFLDEETESGKMGDVTTDLKGQGSYILPVTFKPAWDSLDQYTFIAIIRGDNKVSDMKKEITIKRGNLKVEASEKGGERKLLITFTGRQKDKWIVVSGVELKAFINRNFGKLTIGEDTYTTDEAGTVALEFTVNIPGDETGNLVVGASIEDNDDYGNLTGTHTVAWGLPLQKQDDFFARRTLWSTRDRTPIWLLIFPNLMILLVWGVIVYLVHSVVVMKRIYRNSIKPKP